MKTNSNIPMPGTWTAADMTARLEYLGFLKPTDSVDYDFVAWLTAVVNHPTSHLDYDRATWLDIKRMYAAFNAGRALPRSGQ